VESKRSGDLTMAEFKRTAYSEKLRDPRWQKLRLEILQRDQWTCQICFDTESTLNVHHRWYVKGQEPWEATPNALVTLCEGCHKSESDERPDEEWLLVQVLRERFFAAEVSTLSRTINYLPRTSVPDEAFMSAIEWYLRDRDRCQAIVEMYFEDMKIKAAGAIARESSQ
jgi:hypothetical protein